MQLRAIQRIVGALLILFSVTMLPPALVGWFYAETTLWIFVIAFAFTLLIGLLLWLPVRAPQAELRLRDACVVVVILWVVPALLGAFPFLYSPGLSYVDAVFESLSGLTTTGATVITGIEDLPASVLYYRQQLQWLGGMGIIVLAVAVLPVLGIGGMQLYRAETPGPMKETRLTPRMTETAKALWYIYLALTLACALGYWAAGMTAFDAIGHSFSTVSLGGFSTHDESIGFFHNSAIEAVAVLFMLLAGINFALHFIAWSKTSLRPYISDPELLTYLTVLAVLAAIASSYLYFTRTFSSFISAVHHGIFQAVSIGTTGGFTTAEYRHWPSFLPVMLLLASFIGGCAGSTGGGLKVVRVLLLLRQGVREIKRLVHPNANFVVKIGNKSLPNDVVDSVWGFFSLYVISFMLMVLLLSATGIDLVTAFSAVASCMNNLGPGLGEVGLGYGGLSATAKAVLCLAMLFGRLELFTVLVLFTPAFWRK